MCMRVYIVHHMIITYFMEKGGADVVEMPKESEEAPFLLVVPHLK